MAQTSERHWEAELCRLQAELLLVQDDVAEAEAGLRKAIEVARRRCAKSWEPRATKRLERLWQEKRRAGEAWQMLARVCGWFTEGFDIADLIEARKVLEKLSS